jgi:parallel beta-helix repeat protein
MVASNPLLVVLDVRNQSEYNSGHIKNAKLIPVWELEARISELDENRETLVYCESGVKSATASQMLTEHGFNKVYNMLSGIMAWKAMHYPVYIRYSSLQHVINWANKGDTIFISSGIYQENIVINKSLALVGENKNTTIIDGNETLDVVQINANNTSITNFTIQDSGCGCAGRAGILVEYSHNSSIIGNTIKNNGGYGIKLWHSGGCVVTNNEIANNTNDGIYSHYSNSSTISGNKIINNYNQAGIKLIYTNGHNLTHNTLINNTYSIYLLRANNNKFYHNNFINNTRQVSLGDSFGNVWDYGYPSGGNYWSNYNGTDICNGRYQNKTGSDGIGDTSYIINIGNKDNYPLMGNFSRFSIAWEEQNYQVDIVSNSTVSGFDFGILYASETAYSTKQVSVEFLYWDPRTDLHYCDVCPSWEVDYDKFLEKNDTMNRIQDVYSDRVLVEWKEYYNGSYVDGRYITTVWYDGDLSPDAVHAHMLYNVTQSNSLVIVGVDDNFTVIQGDFNETRIREVIDAYLAEPEPQIGVSFNVTGPSSSVGFCRVVVPKALIDAPYTVLVNGTKVDTIFLDVSNSTYSYLYFTYNLSAKHVVITPEFPSALILPLFIIVTLTMIILMKHKYQRKNRHILQ